MLAVLAIPLSIALTIFSSVVASIFHVESYMPGSLFVDRFMPFRGVVPEGWGPGNQILVEFAVDAACWLVILWILLGLRERREHNDLRE